MAEAPMTWQARKEPGDVANKPVTWQERWEQSRTLWNAKIVPGSADRLWQGEGRSGASL